jgi:hypothetical protein
MKQSTVCAPAADVTHLSYCSPQRMRRQSWTSTQGSTYYTHDGGQRLVSILPVRETFTPDFCWVTNTSVANDDGRGPLAGAIHGQSTIKAVTPWIPAGVPRGLSREQKRGEGDKSAFGTLSIIHTIGMHPFLWQKIGRSVQRGLKRLKRMIQK